MDQIGASPGRVTLGMPLNGSSPFQHQRHPYLEVAPAVTRAYRAVHSLEDRNVSNRFNTVYPAAITTRSAPSELRGLGLYITGRLPDVACDTYEARSTAISIQSCCSGRARLGNTPKTFKAPIALAAKALPRSGSDNKVARLTGNKVHPTKLATSLLTT